ncbi:MAG TPA: hypothetical protein VFI54_19325 [Solirubrobacteraceae bacterium]|nr:hypothetical protein [Solirubrobacteraceae bacterium]
MRRVLERLRRVLAQPRAKCALALGLRAGALVILAAFAFGMVMFATLVVWWIPLLALAVLAGWPLLGNIDGVAGRSRTAHVAATAPTAIAVPVLTLLGVDVAWSSAGLPRPSPAIGLVIAGIVVAAVGYAYLWWVGKKPPSHHERWAAWAAVSGVLLAWVTAGHVPFKLIVTAIAAGVAVWVYLLREGGPDVRHPLWWSLLLVGTFVIALPLFVEALQGGRLSVVLLIAAAVVLAIAALNSFWIEGHLRHPLRFAGLVTVLGVVVLIVVFQHATGTAPAAPQPSPVPVAAATAPLPRAAVDHRPILLFDSGERFRTPLDVDAMLRSGDVQLCPQGKGLLVHCATINQPSDLRNHVGNMRFDTQQIADAGLPTTIYAHAVPDRVHPGWTDIDYWWYLPDNPANTAQGAMCGAGLVIPEITCFDHQSDWEGATLVVAGGQPMEMHFAAHSDVINIPWSKLQATYKTRRLARFVKGRDTANHPLIFIALGSHAAYPTPCFTSNCPGNSVLEDNTYDGAHAWPDGPCSTPACVTGFPVTANGADASWNAFDGYWGSAICIAGGIYCARSNAPRAPGRQGRYRKPWCTDYVVKRDIRDPVKSIPAACA